MLCNNISAQSRLAELMSWFRLRVGLGVLYDCTGEEGLKGAVTKRSKYLKELKLYHPWGKFCCCKNINISVLSAKSHLFRNS